MPLLRYCRACSLAGVLGLLLAAGCESGPRNVQPVAPSAYLLGSLPASPSTTEVLVSPIGLRAQHDQTNGTTAILLDMMLQGPEPLVSETAKALQYRFFFDAPDYIAIRRKRGGSPIQLDRDLYEARQENSFVQFDERVFYKREVDDRTIVIQPYAIYVTRLPRIGTYSVKLNNAALAKALRSIRPTFESVLFDGTAQDLELSYAELKE